jgi:predicted metal-dependent hydrolase
MDQSSPEQGEPVLGHHVKDPPSSKPPCFSLMQALYRYASDAAVTEVFHALSATFPAGEAFFMKSVRHYELQLREQDPDLWQDVLLFLKQEAIHSAQHEKWNRRIAAEYGHPMEELERMVETVMQFQSDHLSPLNQLACTTCFEHFTSTFAHVLLGSQQGLSKMREPQRSLWIWHALEEIEHKSVAFDVYRAVGGGYLRRVLAMVWVTIIFALTFGLVRIFLHWLV